MQETRVRSLGREDPLEKEMATHSSILAWKISWTEEPGRLYSPWGHKESDMTEQLTRLSHTVLQVAHCTRAPGSPGSEVRVRVHNPGCISFTKLRSHHSAGLPQPGGKGTALLARLSEGLCLPRGPLCLKRHYVWVHCVHQTLCL